MKGLASPRPANVALPKDAHFVELRPDALTFQTRECLLPGTRVRFQLVMEGRPWSLQAPVDACMVVEKERSGYLFHVRLSLDSLSEPDRHLVNLFITRGRGQPGLKQPPERR